MVISEIIREIEYTGIYDVNIWGRIGGALEKVFPNMLDIGINYTGKGMLYVKGRDG